MRVPTQPIRSKGSATKHDELSCGPGCSMSPPGDWVPGFATLDFSFRRSVPHPFELLRKGLGTFAFDLPQVRSTDTLTPFPRITHQEAHETPFISQSPCRSSAGCRNAELSPHTSTRPVFCAARCRLLCMRCQPLRTTPVIRTLWGFSSILFKVPTAQTTGGLFMIEHMHLLPGGPPCICTTARRNGST